MRTTTPAVISNHRPASQPKPNQPDVLRMFCWIFDAGVVVQVQYVRIATSPKRNTSAVTVVIAEVGVIPQRRVETLIAPDVTRKNSEATSSKFEVQATRNPAMAHTL